MSNDLVNTNGNYTAAQGFAPRGGVDCDSSGIDVTEYLAVMFTEDATTTLTFADATTVTLDVIAGDLFIVDFRYLSEIATSSSTTLLWM